MNKTSGVVKIYDQMANKYAEIFDGDDSDNVFLDKFLAGIVAGGRLLDLGCGTGRISSYCANKGFSVLGVDLSEKMLEIAKNNYPNIHFQYGDIRRIESSELFDGVLLAYSLFHIEKNQIPEVLDGVVRVLKPDGKIFLALQEGEGEVFADEPMLPGEKIYLSLLSEAEIRSILDTHFKIISFDRKTSSLTGELPYNKMMIIAELK